jgi:hypothetical protein
LSLVQSAAAEEPKKPPVVVELFSSEGCSSCPPADELLRTLDADGRVGNVPVIALELHVDYWNDLGWADPFSRSEWSTRQHMYGPAYTPQAVVDGNEELVGSRDTQLREAITRAGSKPHASVTIARDGESIVVRVAPMKIDEPTNVIVAVADRNLSSVVSRGENAGKTLHHGPIVREMRNLGAYTGSAFEGRTSAGAHRYVAIVQGQKTHHIVGSAAL